MHLVCLGVEQEQIDTIKSRIILLRKYIPSEFARLPRDLREIGRFKATELRMILLYPGPIIFKDILSKSKYLHFMTLHCGLRILCSPNLYSTHNSYANSLLVYFVKNFAQIYGKEYVSHNVHNLIHLSNDRKMRVTLDSSSAFRYKNFLYQLKKTVKFSRYPLQQLVNRYSENQGLNFIIEQKYPQLKNK